MCDADHRGSDERDDDAVRLVAEALAEDRVALAFQPIVSGDGAPVVAFHEGLIRVLGRDGAVVPASAFIASVENHPIGRDLDLAALRLGLDALRDDAGLRLSINMGVHTIADSRWVEALEAVANVDPTIAERLIVEITERAALVSPRVGPFMARLRRLGVSFALDDFGAGYSSFRNLRDLHFDIIKIDGDFIRGIHNDAGNQVMTRALVSIANHFDTLAVAECVETDVEARTLRSLGIDCMQGWLFGRPELARREPAVIERNALAV